MSKIKNFIGHFKRIRQGLETNKEFLLYVTDVVYKYILHIPSQRYRNALITRMLNPYDGVYHIKDIRFPIMNEHNEMLLATCIHLDTFHSYVFCDDKYDEATFDRVDKFKGEGLYGLVNDKVNVTVEPGDIVIDAGSWIGDFAAYASVKGATIYAFEPINENFEYLLKTAELNKNIIPVNKGLSDETTSSNIFVNTKAPSTGSFIENWSKEASTTQVETVRLDDFVHENNLSRVDFIKSDIEGFERYMLAGAQGVLREFAPKLALCTYHLPDDPQVMVDLIKQANPKYNIVQKRKKLFASVPE